MVIDFDDQGANKVISDMCQSHDCRDKLDELHYLNPNFKVTLFTIPAYVTLEMADWLRANQGWVETAMHGFYHTSNYECENWTYEDMDQYADKVAAAFPGLFTYGFKAPGWQISDACLEWLQDHGWWVADQSYNNARRGAMLPAYVNNNGVFTTYLPSDMDDHVVIEAWHGHTWDCVGNGIYETFDELSEVVKNAQDFQFISEVLK